MTTIKDWKVIMIMLPSHFCEGSQYLDVAVMNDRNEWIDGRLPKMDELEIEIPEGAPRLGSKPH